MFGDSILEALDGRLLGWFGSGRIGKGEDVLGKRQERIFRILRIGTHLGQSVRGVDGRLCGLLWLWFDVDVLIIIIFEAPASRH